MQKLLVECARVPDPSVAHELLAMVARKDHQCPILDAHGLEIIQETPNLEICVSDLFSVQPYQIIHVGRC